MKGKENGERDNSFRMENGRKGEAVGPKEAVELKKSEKNCSKLNTFSLRTNFKKMPASRNFARQFPGRNYNSVLQI